MILWILVILCSKIMLILVVTCINHLDFFHEHCTVDEGEKQRNIYRNITT